MQNNDTISPIKQFFNNKWVRISLVIDLVLILVLIGVIIWQHTKVSTINLNITPLDATISINGDNSYKNGQYSVTPGSYQILISKEGLDTKSFTIDLSPGNTFSLSAFLSDSEKTFDFYKLRANFTSYAKLKEIASSNQNVTTDQDKSAESFIQQFEENYKLLNTALPIEYQESEGYGQDLSILKNITIKANYTCKYTLCIQAFIMGTNSQEFIDSLMREKGIKTEDFEVEYKYY